MTEIQKRNAITIIANCSPRVLRRLKFVSDLLRKSVITGRDELDLLNESNVLLKNAGKPLVFNSHSAYRSFKLYHCDKLQHAEEINWRIAMSQIIL